MTTLWRSPGPGAVEAYSSARTLADCLCVRFDAAGPAVETRTAGT
ncbi:hypothetical protein [Streptomyces sp. NBC_01314]|nr:hypothetical protein OG622_44810 [Streptomyces sp. NBC_01314]